MQEFRVFLASSLNELHIDRLELSDLFRRLNDACRERGVCFRLFMCEDEDMAMARGRKQDEYNRRIEDSRLCVVLIRDSIGQYTLEEFEIALRRFRACGSPEILICFRVGEGCAPTRGVLDFMNRLDREPGLCYSTYDHIDALKLALLTRIRQMEPGVPLEFRDGRVLAAGRVVLDMAGIPGEPE